MYFILLLFFSGIALAARPWLYAPDTGADARYAELGIEKGSLPPLDDILCLNDFEWAARNMLNSNVYAALSGGAGTEGSYRMNQEAFQAYRFRPRTMVHILSVNETFTTHMLGYNFSLPFFITFCGGGGYLHKDGELNLIKGASDQNILYIASMSASKNQEEIADAAADGQVYFQQFYNRGWDDAKLKSYLDSVEKYGAKAIAFTIDSAGDGDRWRAARWGGGSTDSAATYITWDYYDKLKSMTDLPILLKGITTVDDAKKAIEHSVNAIYLSNHGGRQLDGASSGFETALEIFQEAPEVFQQIEVYADGGVRSAVDVLKLLALGVRAVGVGCSFMYSLVYGTDGVIKAAEILKHELTINAQNLGLRKLGDIKGTCLQRRMFPPL
ncbi:cytochrome mitochondrial precursor [Fusarium oxysporum f. sp. phaseoli]